MRFGDDPYVWVSWLYYQEGMTQSDIAQTMGISRATVITYLADARERGVVNISIEPDRLSALTLAQAMKRHFNLRDCFVIPSGPDDDSLGERLGAGGALVLRKLLKSGDTLAVTGGRTIMAVGAKLKVAALQDVTVVQATGGAIAKSAFAPELCASTVAAAVGAACVNLSAPALASSSEAHDVMVREPLVEAQFAILSKANKALFEIASLRPSSAQHVSGLFEASDLQQYVGGDAVGVPRSALHRRARSAGRRCAGR